MAVKTVIRTSRNNEYAAKIEKRTFLQSIVGDILLSSFNRYPDEDGEWGDGEPEGEDGEPGEEEENDGDQGGKDGDPDGEEGEQEEEDEDDDEDEDEDADPQQEDDEIECDIPSVPLKTFPAGDLQPKRVKLVIEKCELVGGRTGRQRFRLEGKLREENVRYYTFEGSLHQVIQILHSVFQILVAPRK